MADREPMTEEESFRRGVFPYQAGGRTRYADHLRAFDALNREIPDLDDLLKRFYAPSPLATAEPAGVAPEGAEPTAADPEAVARHGVDVVNAATLLAPGVLIAFGLTPLDEDGEGTSTTEAMALLTSFLDWSDRMEQARSRARAVIEAAEVPEEAAA